MAPAPRSGKGKSKARVHDSDGSGDDGGAPVLKFEGNVQKQYLNQPIDAKQGELRLKTIIAEMKTLGNDVKKSLEILSNAAQDVAETLASHDDVELKEDEVPEDGPQIKQLDREFRLVLDKIQEIKIRTDVLQNIRQKLVQGEQITDIYGAYDEAASAKIQKYEAKTSRQKYMEDADYVGLREMIWECLYVDTPVPNIKKMIAAEPGDEDDSDDEIEVGAQTTDFKCPLLLSILKDPMSSDKCKHHFSAVAIMDYLGDGAPHECPMAGCHAIITKADMKENVNLKKRVEAYVRREQEIRDNGGRAGTQKQPYLEMVDDDDA